MKEERGKRQASSSRSFHRNNDFPFGMTGSQMMHGFRNVMQGIGLLYNRFDLSGFEHVFQNHKVVAIEICDKEDHLLARSQRRQANLDDMTQWANPMIALWSPNEDKHRLGFKRTPAVPP